MKAELLSLSQGASGNHNPVILISGACPSGSILAPDLIPLSALSHLEPASCPYGLS